MSLALLQGYSSAEEEEEEEEEEEIINDGTHYQNSSSSSDDGDEASVIAHPSLRDRSMFDLPQPSTAPGLPSAFDAFSEVSGPPEFLNNSVEEYNPAREADEKQGRHGGRRQRKEKKDLPTGAIVEAKPQLVGIHERVRSDINGIDPPTSAALSASEGKKVATATNPNAEDAADLLRMCLQCGIPKTFSSAKGMVCPVCGDRPRQETSTDSKKKGSTIKEKEKSKRMKGQSSHASWKSETEMHLRQQFD